MAGGSVGFYVGEDAIDRIEQGERGIRMTVSGGYVCLAASCFALMLCLPLHAEGSPEMTEEMGDELEEFGKAAGIPFDDVFKRWMSCVADGASDQVECVKSRDTPQWVPSIFQDPITDEVRAGVQYTSETGVSALFACGGEGDANSVIHIATSFMVSEDALEVVTRIDKTAPRLGDNWSASNDGMGVQLRNEGAREILTALSDADTLAYRITTLAGTDTQVIDLSTFHIDAKSVIKACNW